jgi:hypothetical protein
MASELTALESFGDTYPILDDAGKALSIEVTARPEKCLWFKT